MKLKGIVRITVLITIVFIAILMTAIAWWYQTYKENKVTGPSVNISNINQLNAPGSTDISCTSNKDCINICADDECLVPSCTITSGSNTGHCTCLGIC